MISFALSSPDDVFDLWLVLVGVKVTNCKLIMLWGDAGD